MLIDEPGSGQGRRGVPHWYVVPLTPMPLVRVATAFADPAWVWELKYDGFRALAHLDRGACRLVSRNGHTFTRFDSLARDLARAFANTRAVIDGEVVCLDDQGRCDFNRLLFRRATPCFAAFDLLELDGRDLRQRSLLERKRTLQTVVAGVAGPMLRVQHVDGVHGPALFQLACALDLEGVVGKWAAGTYRSDGASTSWLKVKNSSYSQIEGRTEFFEPTQRQRRQHARRALVLR